jgi:hypothetical protein
MSAPSVPAPDFSLVDDPLDRAQRTLRLKPVRGFGLGRRILLAVSLTYLPLLAWAVTHRLFLKGVAPEPLLQHFGIHARFLLALPLFFVAEATVEAAIHRIVPQFVRSGLVDDALRPRFDAILHDAARLRGSWIGVVVILGLVVASLFADMGHVAENHELSWAAADDAPPTLGFAQFWFAYVARPIFILLLAAWLWRLFVLAHTFARIAKLELRLSPTHPDRVGGLGFVEALPIGLAPLFFALSVVVAARWAHDALYHGLDVMTLRVPAAGLLVICLLVGLFPLLSFAGSLRVLRRQSLLAYGALLAEHGRLVERRWIQRDPAAQGDIPLLSAPEIGPVADTISLYEAVGRTRPAPISRRSLIPIAIAVAVPLLPVFATQIPIKDVILKVLAPLVGI